MSTVPKRASMQDARTAVSRSADHLTPGVAADIYQLGYSAGKRAGEHLAEEKAGGDYWVGYADGLLDGAGCGTEGLKTVGAYLANDDDLTAVGSA